LSASANEYSLNITSDSPVAIGTSITFNLTLLFNGNIAPNNKYQFRYEFLESGRQIETNSPQVLFTIDLGSLEHGQRDITFYASDWFFFTYVEKVHAKVFFNITNRFNGLMELVQNTTLRENGFVSSQAETVHNIVIADKDKKIFEKAAYYRVFWFVDCLYLGE
jgi:hypothetical protein